MIIVWWTIPDSYVAMEWHPEEGITFDSKRVEHSGIVSMRLGKSWQPQWAGRQEPTGQVLADLAATFASEANISAIGYVVTWIDDTTDHAVSWDRRDNTWRLHETARHDENLWVTEKGTLLANIKVSDVKRAGDIALGALDRYRGPAHPTEASLDPSEPPDIERARRIFEQLPGWIVRPEESGNWTATHQRHGVLSGETASKLAETIKKYYGNTA